MKHFAFNKISGGSDLVKVAKINDKLFKNKISWEIEI